MMHNKKLIDYFRHYTVREIYLAGITVLILTLYICQYLALFMNSVSHFNLLLFFGIAALTYFSPMKGLFASMFMLPFLTGLSLQISAFTNKPFMVLWVWALDVCCGLILGLFARYLTERESHNKSIDYLIPAPWIWSVAAIHAYLAFSAFISISRNLNQTSTPWTLRGLFFNLVNIRIQGGHDDFLPLQDLVVFSAVLVLFLFLVRLFREEKIGDAFKIFTPFLYANFPIVLYAILQVLYKIGFYKFPNRGANSFFPDIHSFGGYELICLAVGFIGMIKKTSPRMLYFFGFVTALCGLMLSGSRFAIICIPLLCLLLFILYANELPRKWVYKGLACILLITIVVGILFFRSNSGQALFQSWSWQKITSFDFKTFDSLFYERPGIWRSSLTMWSSYPLMGIGLAAFLRSSSIEGFSTSPFFIASGGENAHNYFIQILTEFGCIGVFVLLMPLLFFKTASQERKLIFGVLIAIALGNLYSHELLVREFLVILVILLGLLFASGEVAKTMKVIWIFIKNKLVMKLSISIIVVATMAACGYEVFGSFCKEPFTYARLCGQQRFDQAHDNWVPVDYEYKISTSHKSIIFRIRVNQPRIKSRPVRIRYGQRAKDISKNIGSLEVLDNKAHEIEIANQFPTEINTSYYLAADRCFVPKSWGIGYDNRGLGILIDEIKFNTR